MGIRSTSQPIARLTIATRLACYALGTVVIGLAVTAYLTELTIEGLYLWLEKLFSLGFVTLFTALVTVSVYAGWRVGTDRQPRLWYEAGLQAASGIATLALTFTLLGISLGIGSLAEQDVNPETIQQIIQSLTKNFSMAFMTTVVGLPSANILRAFVALRMAHRETFHPRQEISSCV